MNSGKFSIITFEDFIAIALDAPRVVGIYPEIKNPVFINQRVSFLVQKEVLTEHFLKLPIKPPFYCFLQFGFLQGF